LGAAMPCCGIRGSSHFGTGMIEWSIVMIREITNKEDLEESVRIVREAFLTVARDFDLTEENSSTNPAFMTFERLRKSKDKGVKFFGLFENDMQIGFVAIEKANSVLFYLEHLAVLPAYRHRGHGRRILDFVFDYVGKNGGAKVSIGIIEKNTILRDWYRSYGFADTSTRRFKHLPFTVLFMEKRVAASAPD